MYNRNFTEPKQSEEEKQAAAKRREEQTALVKFILAGKTKRQAEASGLFPQELIKTAYATVRPWELPNRSMSYENRNPPGVPALTEKQAAVLEMTRKCMTQKEIAKELKCSQSTVAFTLKQARMLQEIAGRALAEAQQTEYQTRIHLFLHGMDLGDAVKNVCFDNPVFVKDIEESISMQASEVISSHLSYSPQQLDKLVMDIVLAAGGRCTIIADSYAVNSTSADTHIVYFIRDCIHTKDISGTRGETGWDIPLKRSIIYLDDWIRYLQVPLSENDADTVSQFNFWRCFYEKNEDEKLLTQLRNRYSNRNREKG